MTDADFEALLRRHEAFIKGANAEGPLIGYWVGGIVPPSSSGRGRDSGKRGRSFDLRRFDSKLFDPTIKGFTIFMIRLRMIFFMWARLIGEYLGLKR